MNYFTSKTILVTGATGLIGSNLVIKLMKMGGIKVIANARNEEKLKELFFEYINNPLFSIYAYDISIPFNFFEKIDIIYHAASPQENKIINNKPLDVIFPNIFGTKNCLDFLLNQEKEVGLKGRLILFSSVTIYSNNTTNDLIVKESDTAVTDKIENNSAAYSQSKRMIEVIANGYKKQFNTDVVTARLSTVYGNSMFKTETAFFDFVKKVSNGEDLTVNNPLVPRRDNIYIDDALEALLILAEKGISGDVYNISSNNELGNFASVYEIAEQIVKITNEFRIMKQHHAIKLNAPLVDFAKRSPGVILDNSKLRLLGWNLKTSLYEGLKTTIMQNIQID